MIMLLRLFVFLAFGNLHRKVMSEPKQVIHSHKQVACQKSTRAGTIVGLKNRLLIYEHLAQTYINLQELTSQDSYGESAVTILQDVVSQGRGTYHTNNNIAILYQKMGQFDEAQDTLSQGQDVEMQLLDKLYQQLEEGGWF